MNFSDLLPGDLVINNKPGSLVSSSSFGRLVVEVVPFLNSSRRIKWMIMWGVFISTNHQTIWTNVYSDYDTLDKRLYRVRRAGLEVDLNAETHDI